MTSSLFSDAQSLDPRFRWHCEPKVWGLDASRKCLRLVTDANTDFWQRTHYGFRADNGHFLYAEQEGDFVLQARVAFRPRHQYDQAGLMVRLSPDCWLKTSVEHEPDGKDQLGVVVTNGGYSDWSTQEVENLQEITLKVQREGGDYLVCWSTEEREWRQLRVAHLQEDVAGQGIPCGVYACSPKGAGFAPEFHDFSLESV